MGGKDVKDGVGQVQRPEADRGRTKVLNHVLVANNLRFGRRLLLLCRWRRRLPFLAFLTAFRRGLASHVRS